MLWRVTMAAAMAVAGFFALTFVFPVNTMGDPAFDIPMLRARWYGTWLVIVAHGIAVLGAFWLGLRGRSLWALAAGFLSLGAFAVFFVEESRLIRYGELTMPYEQAMQALFWSRLASLSLAVLAAFSLWRAHARS